MSKIKLGLIGDNIVSSSAPILHQIAAEQHGVALSYERLIPKTLGLDFDATFHYAQSEGFRGINITLPYKEVAIRYASISAPEIQKLGSVNTICFNQSGIAGFNTDYTGFLKSYRDARGDKPAGHVLLIGAGGVGRAIAFALLQLGTTAISIVDKDKARAQTLAAELNSLRPHIAKSIDNVTPLECDAVVNCSPAGMHGYGGLPLPEACFPTHFTWAFDAVYQPVETPFKQLVDAKGRQFISGFELFLNQGIDAFFIFTGLRVKDQASLRQALLAKVLA